MRNIVFLFILFFSLSTLAFDSIKGTYKVSYNDCHILFIGEKGNLISEHFDMGDVLKLEVVDGKISASKYRDYKILGLAMPSYSHNKTFNRKYKKNTFLSLKRSDKSITFNQETLPFTYYYSSEFCHPYDTTGVSCIVGLLNPFNWSMKKARFEGEKFETEISLLDNGDLLYARSLIEEEGRIFTHKCKLTK